MGTILLVLFWPSNLKYIVYYVMITEKTLVYAVTTKICIMIMFHDMLLLRSLFCRTHFNKDQHTIYFLHNIGLNKKNNKINGENRDRGIKKQN